MQYHLHEDGNILSIRMQVCFKRRSSRKMIIAPSGAGALLNNIDLKAQKPDQSFVAALVKAFQWQDLVDRGVYQRQYEPILYGWKNGHEHFWCGARDQSDIWFVNKPVKNDLHPTMKPVELVERALHNSSKTKDIVLDAFGGSGTTMVACEKTGRRARLIELEPKYADVIVKRWQEFTGKKAKLATTGQNFSELESERIVK